MSLHVFANFVTQFGTAANNRAETEGNVSTLQKLLWMGETHSTVSAEAIRFALRRRLAGAEETNRSWNEDVRVNEWRDHQFKGWSSEMGKTHIDDDLLGYMVAEAAKEDGSDDGKGSANVRRAVLEVTRAVSLTPWTGDVTFNVASPGATPSAAKKGSNNPVPYAIELHATRYQYGVALTPERLRDKSRAAKAIEALCNLGTVAGNHGRFLFDFSPDAVIFRLTQDPAPRLLYCFETNDDGKTMVSPKLLQRLEAEDIKQDELILGVSDLRSKLAEELKAKGVTVTGVKKACESAMAKIKVELKLKD